MKMRVLIPVIVLLLSVTIAAPGAVAQAPARDSVVATEVRDCVFVGSCPSIADTVFEADVESGPAGENPTGTVRSVSGFGAGRAIVEAQATCLKVTGRSAVIGFTGQLRAFLFSIFVVGSARVADLGGADSSRDTFDVRYDLTSQSQPGPTDCSSPPGGTFGPSGDNDLGDIVVTDAQPFPTSKDQCTNGGWRNFPGFKSQGACVSFVARGGTSPPTSL